MRIPEWIFRVQHSLSSLQRCTTYRAPEHVPFTKAPGKNIYGGIAPFSIKLFGGFPTVR